MLVFKISRLKVFAKAAKKKVISGVCRYHLFWNFVIWWNEMQYNSYIFTCPNRPTLREYLSWVYMYVREKDSNWNSSLTCHGWTQFPGTDALSTGNISHCIIQQNNNFMFSITQPTLRQELVPNMICMPSIIVLPLFLLSFVSVIKVFIFPKSHCSVNLNAARTTQTDSTPGLSSQTGEL